MRPTAPPSFEMSDKAAGHCLPRRAGGWMIAMAGLLGPAFASADVAPFYRASQWKLNATIDGASKELTLPDDLRQLEAAPQKQRAKTLASVRLIEANRHVVRVVAEAFDAETTSRKHRLSPDYERSLAEVAIAVPYAAVGQPHPLARIMPALRALPAYTHIHVVMPPQTESAVRADLASAGMIRRARLHPLEDWATQFHRPSKYSRVSRWIRDAFMVGRDTQNKAVAYVPLAYSDTQDLSDSDLEFVHEKWFDPRRVVRLPAFLKGGNVAVADNGQGSRVAFLGEREFSLHHEIMQRTAAFSAPERSLQAVIEQIAAVDQVQLIPNTDRLFHIDMSVMFLAPGVAAVIEPVNPAEVAPEDAEALARIRRTLADRGFRVIPVPTTAERIAAFQSPVNVLPFRNRQTNRPEVIVSRFPDRQVVIDSRPVSLNQSVRNAFRSAGFAVRWADDRLSDRQGNIHCAVLGLN